MMLSLRIQEIFLAQHCIDFRKGIAGCVEAMRNMDLDPYEGDCVLFVHRSWRQLRVVGGDAMGAWMLTRIFEGGRLKRQFPFLANPAFVQISRTELAALLEGVTIVQSHRARAWKAKKSGATPFLEPRFSVTSSPHGKKSLQEKDHSPAR